MKEKCKELGNGDELYIGLDRRGSKFLALWHLLLESRRRRRQTKQFEELGNKVYGTPTIGQLALLRKLRFKATTLLIASINEQVKSDSSDTTSLSKRLPAAEKQSRLEMQAKRLARLRVVGELSPRHQLLDLTNGMVETGVLAWVAPSKCSKRDDEVPSKHQARSINIADRTSYLEGGASPRGNSGRRGVRTRTAVGAPAPWHCYGSVQTFGLGLS